MYYSLPSCCIWNLQVFKISCEGLLVSQLVSLVGKVDTFPPGQAGYTTGVLSVSETFHPEA
jgi:hypothetical protein